MKKIFVFLLLMVVSFALKAQYPIQQNLGSDSTIIYIKGAARTVGGFINGTYTDTSAANLTRIRQYQAAQIFTTGDSAMWFRSVGATKWIRMNAGGGGSVTTDTFYWRTGGNYISDTGGYRGVLGTINNQPLIFMTNNQKRLVLTENGLENLGSSNKGFMMYDTTTGVWSYATGGSGVYTAGNGLTLSGSQFKLGGTLSENTTLYNSGYQYNWNSGLRVLNDTNLHISWRHNQIISNSNNPMALGKWHTKVRWVDKADSSHYYIGVNVSEIQHYTTSLRSNNIISSFDYLGAANYSKITFENDTASVLNTINISGGISNPISTFWARLDLSPESSNQNKNINGWTAGYINQLAMEGTTGTMTGHIDFYAGKTRRSSTYTTTNRIGYYVSDMAGYGHTNRYAIWTAGSGDSVRFDGPVRFPNLPSGKQAKQLYIDGSGTVYQGDSTGTGGGGVYTAGNGLTLSGSQFKLGGSMSDPQTEIQIPDGTELIFQIGAAGRFFINDDGSGDTILYARGNDLRLPIIPSGSSTDSVLVWTAGTGQVKKRNVSSLVSTPTLQEVLTAGSTLTTTNEIYGNANSLLFDNFSSISFSANNVNLNGISSVLSVSDSILLQPNQGILNIDSLHSATIADTLYKKPMTWDTRNGRLEYAANWYGGGGSENLQQVTDNGDTTTNAIQFMERRSVLGTILSDNYTGGGFGSNYDSSFASLTRTFNGSYLEVTGGNGTFNNYVRYNQWNGLNNWTQSVKFVPTNLSGTTYGIGLGSYSSNSFYTSGFVIQFILDNGSDKGKMRIWSNGGASNVETGTSACTFNTTDTLIATVNYLDGVVTATLYNKTQNVSASYTYTFSRATAGSFQAPNTGKFSIYFFGGTQKIFNYTISSNETKNNVVVLGNSITYGYTASEAAKRWVQKLFPGRYSYETSGGPGDRSAEGVQVLPQIKSLSPKYVILALGVNDAGNSVSGSTYSSNITTIVDTLLDNGITPILLSNSPLNSTSVVPYNDTLQAIATRWGLAYINTFDSLKGSGTSWKANYTTDNIHPNDSGHLVIARIIERNAPQIMGDTVIYTNRVKYNPDIRYFFGLNEKTGAMELNQSIISDTSAYNNFVRLSPLSTQTGASIDVTGDGGTTDNIAIFRSAATYSNIVIDATKGGGSGQAALWFNTSGTNKWQFGSDFAANGTKDFYVYDASSTRNPLYITTGGDVRLGGTSGYAGTQAMTVLQGGNVGIGTTLPDSWLHVQDNSGAITTAKFDAHEDRDGEIVNIAQAGVKKFGFHSNGSIEMQEVTDPTAAATGYNRLYAQAGKLYTHNDDGRVAQVIQNLQLVFGAGSGADADTTAFTTSAIYGSFYNDADTIVVTSMRSVLQGTSPDVTYKVWYNDSLNVEAGATALVTAGSQVTNTTTGTNVTSFDATKIPPGVWVWVKTSTVATKPKYFSLTVNGYRK